MGESYLWGWGKNRGLLPSMSYLRGKWQAQHSFLILTRAGMCYGKMLQESSSLVASCGEQSSAPTLYYTNRVALFVRNIRLFQNLPIHRVPTPNRL